MPLDFSALPQLTKLQILDREDGWVGHLCGLDNLQQVSCHYDCTCTSSAVAELLT